MAIFSQFFITHKECFLFISILGFLSNCSVYLINLSIALLEFINFILHINYYSSTTLLEINALSTIEILTLYISSTVSANKETYLLFISIHSFSLSLSQT